MRIDEVLSTDMSTHFAKLGQLKAQKSGGSSRGSGDYEDLAQKPEGDLDFATECTEYMPVWMPCCAPDIDVRALPKCVALG